MLPFITALRLEFAAPVDRASDEVLSAMRWTGKGEATRYIADRGGWWYSFALDQGDSTIVWPGATVISVTLKDSTLAAEEVFVMSPPPEQRILRLGGMPVRLEPGSLWRRRFRNHGIRTVIFARFAHPFESAAVRGAWAITLEHAATPAAHPGGSP